MPARKPRYVFARVNTLIVNTAGRHRLYVGDAWHADHPVVQIHPEMFSDDPPEIHPRNWEPPVEQASAAPGEKRSSRRGN